jgi:TPR repeat protein
LEWLRERSLAGFAKKKKRASHPVRTSFLFVLMVGLSILLYQRWQASPTKSLSSRAPQTAPLKMSTLSQLGSARQQLPTRASEARPAIDEEKLSSRAKVESAEKSAMASSESARATAPEGPSRAQPSEVSSDDTGQNDFAIAQKFLKGGDTGRDSSEAAKLLWRSVRKHNTQALITLADLYARGDGVSKNCEQAEVLLLAAAKRGSADAAQKLRIMQVSGCK